MHKLQITLVLSKHIGNWAVIGLGLFLSAISMIVMPFSYGSYLSGMFKEIFAVYFQTMNNRPSIRLFKKSLMKFIFKNSKVIWSMYGAWNRVRSS